MSKVKQASWAPADPRFDFIVAVEGHSDLYFYTELIRHVLGEAVHERVCIKQFGGKANFKAKADAELETFLVPLLPAKKSIAVVVDADDSAAATIASFEDILQRHTKRTVKNAAWNDHSREARLGLFVVPGAALAGELETLVWSAWANDPANAELRACVEGYEKCMSSKGRNAKSTDKGRIGTVLSILASEDPRVGPAVRDRKFVEVLDRPELAELSHFFRGLVAGVEASPPAATP
jgi:hypothetical protein